MRASLLYKEPGCKNLVLRMPAMYEVKNSKICTFWTFWPVIHPINHLFQIRQKAFLPNAPLFKKVLDRFWKDGIIRQLSTKISRSAVFASCIAGILKLHVIRSQGPEVDTISLSYAMDQMWCPSHTQRSPGGLLNWNSRLLTWITTDFS